MSPNEAQTPIVSSFRVDQSGVVVGTLHHQRRLESYLRQLFPHLSRILLYKAIRKGTIRLNGKRAGLATRLQLGDVLRWPRSFHPAPQSHQDLAPPDPQACHPPPSVPQKRPYPWLIYQDSAIWLINKPAHLACHGGTGRQHEHLLAMLAAIHAPLSQDMGYRPGLVQRLDANVSGVLIVAKHRLIAQQLQASQSAGQLEKTYWAILYGHLPPMDKGMWSFPIEQQGARTHFQILKRQGPFALCALTLITGRKHQIRRHAAQAGCPLWGDERYGGPEALRHWPKTSAVPRPWLHAYRLSFPHPLGGGKITCLAPLPADLQLPWS